jgi:hypothetical protein
MSGDERMGWGAYLNKLGKVRLGKQKKSWKSEALGPQSIRWPVLDENLKERFLKERFLKERFLKERFSKERPTPI